MRFPFFQILTLSVSLSLLSCAKKEKQVIEPEPINTDLTDGIPAEIKKINCYLYSCVQTYQYSSTYNYYIYNYAAFSDPSRNLTGSYNHYNNSKIFSSSAGTGNIDVGNITLNGSTVFKNFQSNFEVYYGGNFSGSVSSFNYNANWITDGNKTFKPINEVISKGHPIINVSGLSINPSISKNTNFTFNVTNNITNYDSLVVILEDGTWNGRVRKTVAKNTASVTFTPQEMTGLFNTTSGKLNIYAFNYSNKIVNDKSIFFELSNQYILNNVYIY